MLLYCCFWTATFFALTGFLWLAWIFISVVYLGGSSACPQNSCQ